MAFIVDSTPKKEEKTVEPTYAPKAHSEKNEIPDPSLSGPKRGACCSLDCMLFILLAFVMIVVVSLVVFGIRQVF